VSKQSLRNKDTRKLAKTGCCKRTPANVKRLDFEMECDNQYSARGHAYNDVMDFAREEFLFFKWFVKAWNMATEHSGDGSLQCVSAGCDVKRDALTAKEERTCPMDTRRWMNPKSTEVKEHPFCLARRIADTKTYHHDNGLPSDSNWYILNREAIPKELRLKGYDSYNIEEYYAIYYSNGGAKASSTGELEFDHVSTPMPPKNLVKFVKWKTDMAKNKTWNQVNNFKWTQDGRGSTCWASKFEKDPWVSLKMKGGKQQVHKVVLEGLYMGELASSTLQGAQIWVDDQLCNSGIRVNRPGVPTTAICKTKPEGKRIILKYPPSTETTKDRRLIVCMMWPYRYDEKYHGIVNKGTT